MRAISADRSDGDRDHAKRHSLRFQGTVGLKLSEAASTRFYASVNHIRQDIPGALTMAEALSTPRKANAGAVQGDQARDIDSLRLQNRTTFDWGALRLDVGGFVNAKSLHHPIFQLIDQKSVDAGGFFRADYARGPVEVTLGGEIRRGSTDARQFVNKDGRRGALTFDADQKAQTATLYGEIRVRPIDALTLVAGGVYADGWRQRSVNFSATPATDGRIDFDAFSPKVGLLFEPAADIQLFANYSRSAEFPGFGEVFQTIGTPPTRSPPIRVRVSIITASPKRRATRRWSISACRTG